MKTRKLKPMTVSMGYREFVLDQLEGLPELRPKPMFGGIGLYSGDAFFGILAADSLYFKVDESSRAAYERAGSTAFAPYADRPQMRMATYYAVPAGIIENAPELLEWARTSIAIAKTSMKAKAAKRAVR